MTIMLATGIIWVFSIETAFATQCSIPKYAAWPGHTACLTLSSDSREPRGVSGVVAVEILNLHNRLRGQVTPPAADMQVMAWDDEIAMIAQKWADNCMYSHDSQRFIPGQFWLGQNLAYGYATWATAIQAWYDEYKDFTYGSTVAAVVGHYTQMAWSNSSRIGCGFASCRNLPSPSYYVCNYGPAGNVNGNSRPYASGRTCDACPGRCKNGLCDCGGKACYNGGTLDLRTCQCGCTRNFHFGDVCQVNCTGARDEQWFCDTFQQQCTTYTNVQDMCPNMCKVCNYIDMQTSRCTTVQARTIAVIAATMSSAFVRNIQ